MTATDNDRFARARVFFIPSLAILELNARPGKGCVRSKKLDDLTLDTRLGE
jgi:hypothetical protein